MMKTLHIYTIHKIKKIAYYHICVYIMSYKYSSNGIHHLKL